jgi:hypothetical protein
MPNINEAKKEITETRLDSKTVGLKVNSQIQYIWN